MTGIKLTEQNFLQYAMHHYANSRCLSVDEFEEDLNRIQTIKKLFFRYKNHAVLRERLILNHLVILQNVFGVEGAVNMLFFKLPEYHPFLKTFLVFLGSLPDVVGSLNTVSIPLDTGIIEVLRKI